MTRLHIGSPASTKQSRSQVSRGESTRSRTNFIAARAATARDPISLHRRVERAKVVRPSRISQSPAVTRSTRFNVEAAISQQWSGAATPFRWGGNCLSRITLMSRRRTGQK